MDGVRFLAMEHVEGGLLDDLVRPGGMPLSDVLRIGGEIAARLAAAIGVENARDGELWNPDGPRILTEVLRESYPARHEVVVFEARTLPVVPPRALRLALRDLPSARVTLASTLYVPPLAERPVDRRMARRLGLV